MDLIDLLRSLPGLALLGVLPGIALATLIRPSVPWLWRLALSPGLSLGVVGVIGLVYHDIHVEFTLATVLPAVVVLIAAACVAVAVGRGIPADPPISLRTRPGLAIAAGGLAAGLISGGIMVSALRAAPLPVAGDSPVHGALVQAIAVDHDVMAPTPIPVAQTGLSRPRPAFEAESALVAGITGMRPVAAMIPLSLLAVLLLPLSLAVLMFEVTGDWRMAAVAPLFGVGMTLMTFAVRFGEYPYLVDLTLVVPMVIAARRALLGRELWRELAMIVVLVASVWVIHGLEIITAVAVGAPLAVASVWGLPWRDVAERAVLVALAVAAAALAITVLTRVPQQPAAVLPPGVDFTSQAGNFLGASGPPHRAPAALSDFLSTEMAGSVAAIPYLLGLLAAIRVKDMRWALVVHVGLLLVLADVGYSVVLRKLWTPLFPWSVSDRVVSIQWFVVPLLMTWGIFHLRQALGLSQRQMRARPTARVLVGLFVAGAAATPFVGAFHEALRIRNAVATEAVAGDADLAALTAMDHVLPPGTVVLTQNRFDAGQWTDAVTRDLEWAPLSYQRGVLKGGTIPLLEDRAWALGHACSDPTAARAALDGIGAVYLGAVVAHGSPAPWKASCIAALPGVRQVIGATSAGHTARVFVVEPAS